MSDLKTDRKYKAISIRYKPEDWEQLKLMKEQYEDKGSVDSAQIEWLVEYVVEYEENVV